jgi:hypothetical protein
MTGAETAMGFLLQRKPRRDRMNITTTINPTR